MEEQVIQPESVTPAEQPVAETATPQAPNLDSVKAEYESKISALESKIAEEGEKFKGIKTKLDDVYKKADDKRKQDLEDQGQWKDLWEEANKTAQEKDIQINSNNDTQNLEVVSQLKELKDLYDKGIINENEFKKAKEKILK